jgi:predicted dehydrogenase
MSSSGIAILGAGLFAKGGKHPSPHQSKYPTQFPCPAHLPALAALSAQGEAPVLKAVYSRTEKSAQDLANAATTTLPSPSPDVYHDAAGGAGGLDALLSRADIAAVVLVLPISLQPRIILKALAAHKHVLSEKPLAPSVSEGRRLLSVYDAQYRMKGLVWRVAENFEAESGYRVAGRAIKEGRIGRVLFFGARVVNYIDQESKWYQTPWRTVPDVSESFIIPM